MAITILPQEKNFAQSLGTGLGQALSGLAENKIRQLQQQNTTRLLQEQGIPGAEYIASLPQAEQVNLLKSLSDRGLGSPGLQSLEQQNSLSTSPTLSQILSQPGSRQRMEEEKLNIQKEKLSNLEAKETREYLKPYAEKQRKLDKTIQRNKEIIALLKTGKVRAGTPHAILSKLGLENFWQSPETQLAQKNLEAQAQGAGAAFNTSRLTNLEVGSYKKSLGTLWNTPEGLEVIAKNNILEAKAEQARNNARNQIIRENNGKIPGDIEQQVDERAQPELAKYAKKAMDNVLSASRKIEGKSNIFQDLPNAKDYKGEELRDLETGKLLVSDGKEWIPKG